MPINYYQPFGFELHKNPDKTCRANVRSLISTNEAPSKSFAGIWDKELVWQLGITRS